MPSYSIHLAVAAKYLEQNFEEDKDAFIEGVIAPDILKKPESHYGPASSNPDIKLFVSKIGIDNSYKRGYYLHLLTDLLFYNDFLPNLISEFTKELYIDYDRLNHAIISRYDIKIPKKIKDSIRYLDEKPKILSENAIFAFIDAFDKIKIFDITSFDDILSITQK